MGATLKILKENMKTIAEDIKYPEFKEQYKNASWITGHLVMVDGKYYWHSKRTVYEYSSYEELPEFHQASVDAYNEKKAEETVLVEGMKRNIKAHNALVEWAKTNAYQMSRSNQSESEYYFVHHTDGNTYEVRVSGHRYPTGSMTDMLRNKIDSTDTCCAKYCEMLGIEF